MAPSTSSEPRKRALLIGIDDYGPPSKASRHTEGIVPIPCRNLLGCVNDVLAVRDYLIHTHNFDTSNIEMLLSPISNGKYRFNLEGLQYEAPTYQNIVDALAKIPTYARKGDMVYIHFSGHGAEATTVFPTLKGDEKVDHALVPSDINSGGQYVRDLEIRYLLDEIVRDEDVLLTVVLDCCHSGGAVRGDDDENAGWEGVRGIRELYDSDLSNSRPNNMDMILEKVKVGSWMHQAKGFVVLTACMEYQKAHERPFNLGDGSHTHGCLTFWLLEILRNINVGVVAQTIHDMVREKLLVETGSPRPRIIGDNRRFFLSSRSGLGMVGPVVLKIERRMDQPSFLLNQGQIHGVVRNSVFLIIGRDHDPNTVVQPSDVLARVKVTDTPRAATSTAYFESPPENDHWKGVEGCPAVFHTAPAIFKVRFQASRPAQEQLFTQGWYAWERDDGGAWRHGSRLSLVDRDQQSAITVRVDKKNQFQISGGPGELTETITEALEPIHWSDATSITTLRYRLEHLARFRLVWELTAPAATGNATRSAEINIGPSPEPCPAYDGEEIIPADQLERADDEYLAPEKRAFRIAVTNRSDRRVFVTILYLSSLLGIDVMYFKGRIDFHALEPGAPAAQDDLWVEIPTELKRAAGEGFGVRNMLKILVFTSDKSLASLALPALPEAEKGHRGDEPLTSLTSLDDLLEEIPSSRDIRFSQSRASRDRWESEDIVVRALV